MFEKIKDKKIKDKPYAPEFCKLKGIRNENCGYPDGCDRCGWNTYVFEDRRKRTRENGFRKNKKGLYVPQWQEET